MVQPSARAYVLSAARRAPSPARPSRRAAIRRRRAPALTAFATLLLAVSAPVASAQSYSYSYFYETVTFAPSAAPEPAPTALPIPAPTLVPPAPTAQAIPAPTALPTPAPTAAPVVLAVSLTVEMDCADCELVVSLCARARWGGGQS